jgi:hypothetical protein
MFSVTRLMPQPPASLYTDAEFRSIYEMHILHIVEKGLFTIKEIPKGMCNKYIGDFYGLLRELNISTEMHWFTMRLSGYLCSYDYDGSIEVLMIPNRDFINKILGKKSNISKIL